MNTTDSLTPDTESERFARCIAASKRVRWDIDEDVIQGRQFDYGQKFLPDGLSLIDRFESLSPSEKRFVSQIQGRTYANVFGLVERFINAKVLEISRDHWFGDQVRLEALIRFCDEELKHQELFRRVERLAAEEMPDGYVFLPQPNDVAGVVLDKSTWSVMVLTLLIELFTQAHYRQSIEPDQEVSELFRDIFLYHWKEESQHAIMDELELVRLDADLSPEERDRAVDDFIALAVAVDGILQSQSAADADYFSMTCGRPVGAKELDSIRDSFLAAYRHQYILSGAEHPHFLKVLTGLITEDQAGRIMGAVDSLR